MEWSTGNSYGSNKTVYLCFQPLPVPMAVRITKYLNKYVRMCLCLIHMSSFYFWSPSFARKMRKTNMRYYPNIRVCQAILETGNGRQLSHNGCTADNFDLPDHGFLLLTCSTCPMKWSTGNSYQAEALTNVLRYHTCRSSLPEDRKLPITELKWDARTLTDIQVIPHIGFSHFSGKRRAPEIKTRHMY
jgi:hypothetical protein